MHNLSRNIGKVDDFYFSETFLSVVKLRICLNIIVVFCITEHANLPLYSTDKFTHLGHFAISAELQIPSLFTVEFCFYYSQMPLFLVGIIKRISLIVLKEFRCFFDFKIFDVFEVLFWRITAST